VGRATFVVLAGVVAATAVGGSAHAAPPWSEPLTIAPAAPTVGRATLAFGPRGTALLSRRVSGPDTTQRWQDTDRIATLSPDGQLVDRTLPDQLAAPPVVFGRGRVALLRQTVLSEPEDPQQRLRLRLSLGTVDRPVGRRPRRIASFTQSSNSIPTGSVIAAGPRGQLAIVWREQRDRADGSSRFSVRLALRRPSGRWDRTRTVASGVFFPERGTDSVAVAFGAGGDVVVAYQVDAIPGRAASVSVRTLRRGRRFDRPQPLGPHQGVVDLKARSADGRVVVAWATQDGGESADTPSVVRAAIRAPGARRFGPTRIVDPGEAIERAPGRLCLAMGPDGAALLAWSNVRGRFPDLSYLLRAAIAEPGAGFGPIIELAPAGGAADAAVRSDGAMLVLWTTQVNDAGQTPPQTLAALRPGSGGPFGPPELIDDSVPAIGFDRGAAAAFDPATGRPALVWTASAPTADELKLSMRTG
jgi:hypothetical protein